MRTIKIFCLVAGLVLLLVLVACGSGTPTTSPASASATPMPAGETAAPTTVAQATVGTTQQVSAGKQVYDQQCTVCHGADLQGVSGPPLTQSYAASFGRASDLADYISKRMPLTSPGSLSQDEALAVTAYILDQDGLLPAGTTLTPQNVGTVSLSAAAATPTGVSVAPSTPTPAQQVVVQVSQIPSVGSLLVTHEGFTLYSNSDDGPDRSSCTGTCAEEWTPLTVPEGVTPLAGEGTPGTLGTLKRADGSYQVTYSNPPNYDRTPLYTYFADMWAGDRNGNLLLGRWADIVLAAGTVPTSMAPTATGPAATSTATPGSGQGVAALGAADYLLNCSSCHGVQGEGVDAPALRNSPYIQGSSDQTIANTIADGIPHTEMPAWLEAKGGPLMTAQIDNIVAYLHTLQGLSAVPSATPEPPQPSETPTPPGAPTPEPARPSMSGGPGAAATMIGNISQGEPMFGAYCAICHGPEGVQGIANPDSDDESVPPLNPIDPTIANPDPKTFAYNLDLFMENGSIPEGEGPLLLMPPFGARDMLTQQQIADLIAYVMSLNGVTFSGTPSPTPSPQATTGISQVTAGQQAYDQDCAVCHGADLQGVSGPALTETSVGRFGDAKSLLDFISQRMPPGAGGSLSTEQYDAITAYILDKDGLLPAGTTLTEQNASTISLNQ
jgi:mono/diheme cytochrome c family protein